MPGVNPNIEYARPIEVSSEPFQTYLRQRQYEEQNDLAKDRLAQQSALAENRLALQREKDIERQLKEASNLGKYNIGGLWQPEQQAAIENTMKEYRQKVLANDPNADMYLAQQATQLEANRKNAEAYSKAIDEMSQGLAKTGMYDASRIRPFLVQQTAFGPDGAKKSLGDIDFNELSNTNPSMLSGIGGLVDRSKLADAVIRDFPESTTTVDNTNRANGVTNQVSKTVTASPVFRVDPRGNVALNTDTISGDPALRNHYFDTFRSRSGNVDLIKDNVYQVALRKHPALQQLIRDEIENANKGLNPGDDAYIDLGTPDADLVGRAVLTNILAGKEKGNFRLRTLHGENQSVGKGEKKKNPMDSAGWLERWLGAMHQDKAHLDNAITQKLPDQPVSGEELGNIKDVTSNFKGFNVAKDASGKGVEASHVVVHLDDPGKVFVVYPDGSQEVVTENQLPTWLNQKSRFNKSLDPIKLNQLYPKYFDQTAPSEPPQGPSKDPEPTKPEGKVTKALKSIINSITGGRKATATDSAEAAEQFRSQFENPM